MADSNQGDPRDAVERLDRAYDAVLDAAEDYGSVRLRHRIADLLIDYSAAVRIQDRAALLALGGDDAPAPGVLRSDPGLHGGAALDIHTMNVGVVFEFSGEVRDAFVRAGHEATSYDLLPSERPGQHIQGDAREADLSMHDILIFHPPCTDIAVSGAKHFHPQYDKAGNLISVGKIADGRQEAALELVRWCMAHEQPWALENPISVISSKIRKPDQIVQPWMFGHPENKATCLWLNGLPKLARTNNVRAQMVGMTKAQTDRVHHAPPSPDRWKDRSRTYQGIAEAMATQWGGVL